MAKKARLTSGQKAAITRMRRYGTTCHKTWGKTGWTKERRRKKRR